MKKNVLLLVCVVFLSMGNAFAANVSVQQAQAVARHQVCGRARLPFCAAAARAAPAAAG